MKPIASIVAIACLMSQIAISQQTITLEAIWKDNTFATKSVPGFNFLKDGRHYTRIVDNVIKKYDITTGASVADLFDATQIKGQLGFEGKLDGYTFSEDETKILITSETTSIYRRSYKAKYHIYDLTAKKLYAIYEEGKVMNATFSPDASKVAYVLENNLYYLDLATGITLPVTDDGEKNSIINGVSDWVYEEEFSIVKTFWWSPDGQRIAYLKFDETEVPEFSMTYYKDEVYPEYYTFKYPKVGEKNAVVSAHIYELATESSLELDLGELDEIYIPRVYWTQDPTKVCLIKLNRHQNHLQLLLLNAKSGISTLLLEERNKYYIDITDDLVFLKDGKHFIWTSEKSGYQHIYKYDLSGKEKCAITQGDYDVTAFYGIDELNGKIYYQAAEESPLSRHIYEVDDNGKKKQKLTRQSGWNGAQWSGTFDYFTLQHSDANKAPSYRVMNRGGQLIREIEGNAKNADLQKTYDAQPLEFFEFSTSEGVQLNGWMIKPANFDPTKKHPVFMTQYSGPGSQQVTDNWKGPNYWWYQMLAQKGFIIACVDPRGTGARGEEFKKMTYLQLGKYETIDQIEAAKYLTKQPYVDPNRIGIYGWSYGGYMSSLCILKGNDVFKAAIAVAPVTNWKWYDTVYTERYMRTSKENDQGYRDNSPVYFADRLKGNYLLMHGVTDDNVHLQNTMEMTNALINANKQFDTYVYPNRNHGISSGNARLHLYTKMNTFLMDKLMNDHSDIIRP